MRETIICILIILSLIVFAVMKIVVEESDFCKDGRCQIDTEYTLLEKQTELLKEIKLELDNNYGHCNNN